MLLIGHRGCGKSTLLNKVAEELADNYDVVSVSVANELDMTDIETVDILLLIYLRLLTLLDRNWLIHFLEKNSAAKEFIASLKKILNLAESVRDVELLNVLAVKFKLKNQSPVETRRELYAKITELLNNIETVCHEIETHKNKSILIMVDDLEKLPAQISEKIFFENRFLLTLPKVKIIYTFPLEACYRSAYVQMSHHYDDLLIPIVRLKNKDGQDDLTNIASLWKLINRRISADLIKTEAWNYFIDNSGGLLRDLVKFMQDACKLAIVEEKEVIDLGIAHQVVSKYANGYCRIFDTAKYKHAIDQIVNSKEKEGNEELGYFLQHLLVLEYRQQQQIWYDIHPCLKTALATGLDSF
jgi:hypothetical protein